MDGIRQIAPLKLATTSIWRDTCKLSHISAARVPSTSTLGQWGQNTMSFSLKAKVFQSLFQMPAALADCSVR
jgi:hypothetical protein